MNPELARQQGLEVHESIEQIPRHQLFDCITLWHSLEHMRDPLLLVKQLECILSTNGTLIVAVPDTGGWQARLFGAKWFHLDVPRHLFHFNRRSLAELFDRAGLHVVGSRHQEFEYDLFGWSQSALNVLLPTPNVFFNLLTGRATATGKLQIAASYLLGVLFSALALPALAAGTLMRRGGTIIVAARKYQSAALLS